MNTIGHITSLGSLSRTSQVPYHLGIQLFMAVCIGVNGVNIWGGGLHYQSSEFSKTAVREQEIARVNSLLEIQNTVFCKLVCQLQSPSAELSKPTIE